MSKTIEDVRRFWDANPLRVGEIDEPVGTEAWFLEFDRIKTQDVFLGHVEKWTPARPAGKRVLDVGCGPGYWGRLFGRMGVEYYGIDISPNAVELARESQRIFGFKGDIRVGNAEDTGFEDGYFDFVVSEGVIHHTPNTEKCIDEIHRVLKDGGGARIGLYYKSAILRSRVLFRLAQLLMRAVGVGLKGRGRTAMGLAESPEEFVRMYDGRENPIGKAYGKPELLSMFSRFSDIRLSRYYFPWRALPVKPPLWVRRILGRRLGLMVLVELRK